MQDKLEINTLCMYWVSTGEQGFVIVDFCTMSDECAVSTTLGLHDASTWPEYSPSGRYKELYKERYPMLQSKQEINKYAPSACISKARRLMGSRFFTASISSIKPDSHAAPPSVAVIRRTYVPGECTCHGALRWVALHTLCCPGA